MKLQSSPRRVVAGLLLVFTLVCGGLFGSRVNSAASTAYTELLVNGGFEEGTAGWTQSSSGGYDLINNFNPRSGTWGAYLGGIDNADDRLSQQVTLPGDITSITLHVWWAIATEETGGGFDTLTISLLKPDGTLLADLQTIDNSAPVNVWDEAVIDLTTYARQTVTLRFAAQTDASNPTDFYVDDVSVVACFVSPTVTPTATASAQPPSGTPTATAIAPTPSPTPTGEPAMLSSYLPCIFTKGD